MKKGIFSLVLVAVMVSTAFQSTRTVAYAANDVERYQTISAGTRHSMAIKADNSLWTWGGNFFGQLGNGKSAEAGFYIGSVRFFEGVDEAEPIKVLDDVLSVSAGHDHTVAIKSDGSLWGWGNNFDGQLGYAVSEYFSESGGQYKIESTTPVKILDNVISAKAGSGHTLAITTDGSLWAWGDNTFGQLGDGTFTTCYEPIKIMDGVFAIDTTGSHSAAIKTDGSLWTWGYNKEGQLGDGTTETKNKPVKVLNDVISVSAGGNHTLAIRTDNSLWAWGDNYCGEIGNGEDGWELYQLTALKVMDDVRSASAGHGYSIALKNDGTLWSWGSNNQGQLGNGLTTWTNTPSKTMSDVVNAYAGFAHVLLVKTDGSLWAWGSNFAGQIGNAAAEVDQYTPVKIMEKAKLPSSLATSATPVSADKPSSWAETQVTDAIAANLVPQSLQSKYTQAITRAEFCALAGALYENVKGEITERKTFTDTKDENAEKMAAIGVVAGTNTEGTLFSPDTQLTREQAATMLARLADAIGKPLQQQESAATDKDSFSSWAADAIGQVQAAGIMSSTSTTANVFSPKSPYTREQSIVTILRLFEIVK